MGRQLLDSLLRLLPPERLLERLFPDPCARIEQIRREMLDFGKDDLDPDLEEDDEDEDDTAGAKRS